MLEVIFTVFWFFLPAGLANMFPIFAAHLPVVRHWDYPMDFNLQFRGQRVLGSHKTIRGLITAVIVGMLFVLIQKELFLHFGYLQNIVQINYAAINPFILGALLGLGAILGDAVKSFFKRQVGIPSGETWMFFDQLDYIIGGILFTYWYVQIPIMYYILLIIIYFSLHLLSTVIGHRLGLKEKPL